MKMTSLKRCLSGLLAALMLVTLLPTSAWAASTVASGTCGDNLTWTLDSTGTLTISGTGAMEEDYYTGAPWYNYRHDMKRTVIEQGVTSIGNDAFQWCTNLCSISIPNSVTRIGRGAFEYCESLTSITIPNGVTSIKDYTFFFCTSLSSISLGNNLTSINNSAFYNTAYVNDANNWTDGGLLYLDKYLLDAKEDITTAPIRSGTKLIAGNAFFACYSLTSITIPSSVTGIGECAFISCTGLRSLIIPDSVTRIDNYAFANCTALTDVYYTGSKTQWNKIRIGSDDGELSGATIHYNWAPAAPKISSTTVASSGAIKLTWNKVDGAAKYYIYRSTDGGSTYKYYDSTTKTTYTNTSVTPGKTYYYKLKATASGTTSKYSNAVSRTADCARPVVKISNVASSGAIKLSWSAVTGASKYYIYRSTDGGKTYSYYTSTTSTSWTNKSVTPGKTYYYKVKAICGKSSYGNSAYSAVVSRTADCAKPVVTIQLNGGKPQLKWKAITGAEEYVIYRATSKNGTYTKMYTTTKLSYTNTGAKSGTTYYYKVKAICGRSSYGNSAYSSVVSIRSK